MNSKVLEEAFLKKFDVVGIISTFQYLEKAKSLGIKVPHVDYPTLVVLGLAYPKRTIKHTKTHLVPSFYTFGSDYHTVLKNRIKDVMKTIEYPYLLGVDNHPHDERLAATLSGIGYYGKNQLIIHPEFGTYLFLGMVFIDVSIDQDIVMDVVDDCGTCRICIDSCPVQALSEQGFDMNRCMSHYNQSKRMLSDAEISSNYALFGCDICQMVCPKNIHKKTKVHPEFELNGKEMVRIVDLFTDSDRVFRKKYEEMSYLWKGKTILMRNALMVLLKNKNTLYNDLIKQSLDQYKMPWYQDTATRILEKLKQIHP